MCIMCIEIAKQRMTIKEARNALPEMISSNADDKDLADHLKTMKDSSDTELEELAQKSLPKEYI